MLLLLLLLLDKYDEVSIYDVHPMMSTIIIKLRH